MEYETTDPLAGTPAIVLIHSDHGPGLQLEWESPAETNMRERMSILLAVRFPGDGGATISDRTTLVNVYRTVINRALGTGLPLLEDHAYFSTWTRPFVYVDVTDRVGCGECRQAQAGAHTVGNGRAHALPMLARQPSR